ncbi:UNKNOWN [Stylonychia lemnae]|uniref:Uncharacterized protein n=1 Tax=Stylonychia lemnae TaxID=5949 RepID=A0A078AFN9_STYLE|nr:UNKNOWN [Stylonychia lemnae]|eukprot:CDW81054.1 UNKNOWN [Stylonychia lemnae]
MKALQTFFVRAKAYYAKDTTKLNEIVQKRMVRFFLFLKYIATKLQSYLSARLSIEAQKRALVEEQIKKQKISLLESEQGKQNSDKNSFYFEGLLEIFNTPAEGSKQFCGRYIELEFFHTVEFTQPVQNFENASIYSSHYSFGHDHEDDMSQSGIDSIDTEYIRHRAENLLNISLAQTQFIYTINEVEGESGSSRDENQSPQFI